MTYFVHHSAEIFGRLSERNRSNSAVAAFKRSFMEAFDFNGMRIADVVLSHQRKPARFSAKAKHIPPHPDTSLCSRP